jgi:glycosyltransferase involved in cell wall biosynthesis
MRIVLAISTLGPGGAERVISLLANELALRGHAVTLLTFEGSGDPFFPVDEAVSLRRLALAPPPAGPRGKVVGNLQRIAAMRGLVASVRPDVVLSFITETNVIAILACLGLRVPVVVSERVDPREHGVARSWALLRRLVYPLAHTLVVQTTGIASWARSVWNRRPPIVVIPNPVAVRACPVPPACAPLKPYLLAVGRLTPQKGMDVLVDAFARVAAEIEDVELWIAGSGPDEASLRRLALDLGVAGRVRFLGHVKNVHELMFHARVFVLASRYEGFPNVLLEALAAGAASIATDCPTGPREILDDGKAGLLVRPGDAADLAHAVRRLLGDPALIERLRELGPNVAGRFSVAAVTDRWERLLREAGRG